MLLSVGKAGALEATNQREQHGNVGWNPGAPASKSIRGWCDGCDHDDLHRALGCVENNPGRPVPSLRDYMIMRRAYERVVGEDSTISPVVAEDAFLVPHYAGVAPGKGRGIFAKEFVPEGTPLFNARQSATFYSGDDFRKFLGLIPKESGCDILYWAYGEWENEERTEASVSVELDDTALCNDANTEHEYNAGPYAGCGDIDIADCGGIAYARRDIQPGEEILCSYKTFDVDEAWDVLGIGGLQGDSYLSAT